MAVDAKRLQSVFLAAVDAADRAELLNRECAGDVELRAGVEKLLAAHDDLADLPPPPEPTCAYSPIAEKAGAKIGSYVLREQIGEGGYGLVFVADQVEPVKRKVALKVIKPGMDSRQVIARFEAERQALALMDHPNIAKVLAFLVRNSAKGPMASQGGSRTCAGKPDLDAADVSLAIGAPIAPFLIRDQGTGVIP